MTQKRCLECGTGINNGRPDKKFCSDYCRNSYNNRQNSDVNNYMRNINHVLRKNRRIMESLVPNGRARIHREALLSLGFNFDYHTTTRITKQGETFFFCYEYGYMPVDGEYCMLVKRQELLV